MNPEPSPRLRDAFESPLAKRRHNRRLFGTIAPRYDLITRLLSFGRDQAWKRALIARASIGPRVAVLDLACGTGDLALRAADAGARVVALDLAEPMVALARRKPGADRVRWVVGDMGALPFADATTDVITTGYGLRNVPALPVALAEMCRVLRPGGLLCALDFDRPRWPPLRAVYLTYLEIVGGSLGWALHRDPETYRYIPASIRRYPGAHGVAGLMRDAGFQDVRVVPVLGGLMAIHIARR
jgi:ubiquinone/menaquinone biosynthesis methyltransferase